MEEQIISSLLVCRTTDKIWRENRRRVVGKAVGSYTVGGLLEITALDIELLPFLSKTSLVTTSIHLVQPERMATMKYSAGVYFKSYILYAMYSSPGNT